LDYREFLRDQYEERKAVDSFFSYRFLARRTGLDASYIVKLFQGKVHLAERKIDSVCSAFSIEGEALEYFEILVAFNKAKTDKQARALFERLNQFRGVKSIKLRSTQFEYYQHWYYSAVRSFIATGAFKGDFNALAKNLRPAITVHQAKKAVKLLLELGLISLENETYQITDQFLTTDSQWRSMAIRKYQKEYCDLAKTALDECPKELRDFSTLTLSLSEGDLEEIADRMKEFRQSILKLVESTHNADRVYQMNLQLFPLAFIERGNS